MTSVREYGAFVDLGARECPGLLARLRRWVGPGRWIRHAVASVGDQRSQSRFCAWTNSKQKIALRAEAARTADPWSKVPETYVA